MLIASQAKSQTPGGANGMVFRFTKQVWLNPTIILAKQNFEQSTNVKLLILPRVNGDDTTGSSRIEKAFDKLLSFLVFKENKLLSKWFFIGFGVICIALIIHVIITTRNEAKPAAENRIFSSTEV